MSNCVVCGQITNVTCICGFCPNCVDRFTHEGCRRLIEDRMKEDSPLIKMNNKNNPSVKRSSKESSSSF